MDSREKDQQDYVKQLPHTQRNVLEAQRDLELQKAKQKRQEAENAADEVYDAAMAEKEKAVKKAALEEARALAVRDTALKQNQVAYDTSLNASEPKVCSSQVKEAKKEMFKTQREKDNAQANAEYDLEVLKQKNAVQAAEAALKTAGDTKQLAFTKAKGIESVDKLQAEYNYRKAISEALEKLCK
ncbi:hypothetical protein [Nannocystis punicea]|uniref:Uncharacterized protein n=1 Tax=Nannocystis punicea TaxID=2995304 RepID=A0ABY7H6D1_9BACT|nr:hypothetical protein [Nannocystis poenicansa]WAS94823.1 hypothetical protein O0S08_01570 [Nannocystis poenicansa]